MLVILSHVIVYTLAIPISNSTTYKYIPSLFDVTVEELAYGLDAGQFTSVDLVNAYVARISETSQLHAITELNPDALTIAAELDAARQAGTSKGPLHGIPILIKNNIATADLMNNTAGSYALLGAKVPRDSTIAARLRSAGVIILGKSNLSQWANFRSTNSSNGWSALGGQVFGAYYPQQDPSGSSSGSAVASSIGLALASLGSETDGSIISPSEVNNVVGIKPSVGLTSRYLVVPISEHQDTIGPIARTVRDAAHVLQAIAGPDPRDNYTLIQPSPVPDYVSACKLNALKGARIGIPRNAIRVSNSTTAILEAFEAAIPILEAAGATIVESNYSAFNEYVLTKGGNETLVLETDFLVNLKAYLDELTFNPTNVSDLASVRNFTVSFPAEEYPDRNVATWDEALKLGYDNTDYRAFQARESDAFYGGPGGIDGALEAHNLTALLLPTAFASGIPAIVGYPVITVPLGAYPQGTTVTYNKRGDLVQVAPGIPFGISFIGTKFTEETLIGYAYAYEQRTAVRNRISPKVLPKLDLRDAVVRKEEMRRR